MPAAETAATPTWPAILRGLDEVIHGQSLTLDEHAHSRRCHGAESGWSFAHCADLEMMAASCLVRRCHINMNLVSASGDAT